MKIFTQKSGRYLKLFFFLGFVLALANALIAYIESSFLSEFLKPAMVSLVFIGSYALTFFLINSFPAFIQKFKPFYAGLAVFLLLALSLLGLGFSQSAVWAISFFIISIIALNLSWIVMDVYVENFSRDATTGQTRGLYWTIVNVAWLIAPVSSGAILEFFPYQILFLLAAILTSVVILFFSFGLGRLDFPAPTKAEFWPTFRKILKNPRLNRIFAVAFLLQVFYAAMIIYAPLYLHWQIGFGWDQIGVMFTIMLTTFVFMTYPAGWLADKFLGEKEIMTIGLLIMSVTTVIFGFLQSTDFWLWTAILFLTRVGASLADIMRETYFFKQIKASEVEIINLFRNTGPLAYVMMPALAALVLFFSGYQLLFILVGLLMLIGAGIAAGLKDTR